MSAFYEGKLSIKCSLDLLRRALINIMPEWEKHIRVDPTGQQKIIGYGGRKVDTTYHIVIAGPSNPNFPQAPGNGLADIGMRQTEDGYWEIAADRSGIRNIANLDNEIKGELLRMRAKAYARLSQGAEIVKEVNNKEEVSTYIAIDKEVAKKLIKMAG